MKCMPIVVFPIVAPKVECI